MSFAPSYPPLSMLIPLLVAIEGRPVSILFQMALILVITMASECPQNPANCQPPRASGGLCSSTLSPAGLETFACPYCFQLMISFFAMSSRMSEAIRSVPGTYSTTTCATLENVRSASWDQYSRLSLGRPTWWCVPSVRGFVFPSLFVLYPIADR